jgi:hypothetical protein
VARQKEPFRKCCCCFESLFISLLGRKTASSTTFEILPTWLAAGAAWHTSSVGPRRTDARLSHTFQTPVSVGACLWQLEIRSHLRHWSRRLVLGRNGGKKAWLLLGIEGRGGPKFVMGAPPTLLSERFLTTESYLAILSLASKLLKLRIEVL